LLSLFTYSVISLRCITNFDMMKMLDLQAGFGKIEDSGNAAQEAEGKEEVEVEK
jgi:hypothetical protein